MAEIKNPFGLRDGRILHVSEVERGRACMCICPNCKKPLEAAKGHTNRHHFRHQHEYQECENAFESAIHLAAKQIIAEKMTLNLPKLEVQAVLSDKAYSDSAEVVKHGTPIHFSHVDVEVDLDNVRPDLIGYKGTSGLAIEVFYRHAVTPEKKQIFKKLNLSAIEINLSKLTEDDVNDWEQLWLHVSEPDNIKWIYNARESVEVAKLEKKLSSQRQRDVQRVNVLVEKYKQASSPQMINSMREKAPENPAWLYTRRYFPYKWEDVPHLIDVQTISGDWIYGCDRRVWQSSVFNYFVQKLGVGTKFTTSNVDRWLITKDGINPLTLVKSLLFEIKDNPNLVPDDVQTNLSSSWRALNQYFEELCTQGFLVWRGRDSEHSGSWWYEVIKTI